MADCIYMSLSRHDGGKCQLGWDDDAQIADTENYAIDENGFCTVEGDEFPGDSCSDFNGGYGNCTRCGEICCECMCGNLGDADLCDECAGTDDFD